MRHVWFTIRDNVDNIIGRINLIDIDTVNDVVEIGFRVGKEHVGKGVGSNALKLLLKTEATVKKAKGKTTVNNVASQSILGKNSFKQVCINDDFFEMNGKNLKFIHYIWEAGK